MKSIMAFSIFLYTIIFGGIVYSQNIEWITVPSGSFTFGENDEIRSIDSDYEIMNKIYIIMYESFNELSMLIFD